MKYLLFIVVFFTVKSAYAQRIVLPLNNDWQFSKDNFSFNNENVSWQQINLPHTWNAEDVMDDEPGYYRGDGWYRKKFRLDKKIKAKEIYFLLEGANQTSTIFINRKKIKEHIGGYTGFAVNLTPFLHRDADNELLIKVNNSHDKNIAPLTADFTFYGGIYRDVQLIATEPVHFLFDEKGGKGLYISTPVVNDTAASVHIHSKIFNSKNEVRQLAVATILTNAAGKQVGKAINTIIAEAIDTNITRQEIRISNPILWSPANPYLYKVKTTVTDVHTGKTLDEIIHPLGLRWFSFDGTKGFFLNGKPLKLIGASRHQDFQGLGNAVPDSTARRDVALLKEMGANFLRVAHYPQDPSVLQACDEMGLLASVEIPVVNEITETDSFYNNCIRMQQEMIQQHYNHPSVIIWCYMNEILLRPSFNNDKERQKKYFSNIAGLAKKLDSVTRSEDPSRYTMIAHHGNYNLYKELGLIDIPMVVGWNLYQGWYGSNINDLPAYLDRFHKDYPQKPMMVTEYGADADPRIRSLEPVRFDKSVEYATGFHQYYYQQIMQRPFVAGAQVWNLADFNSETRNETMPHVNNKGLLQWNRTPKDPYYYYKAMLAAQPFVKILGDAKVAGVADSSCNSFRRSISAATNAGEVIFSINGKQFLPVPAKNGIAAMDTEFKTGIYHIEATVQNNASFITDKKNMESLLYPAAFNDGTVFQPLNILMGANRFFTDSAGQIWIPDRPYSKGSWGSVGGKRFKLPKGQLPYGTDKNIKATVNDPVYQTQLAGITGYILDVPDGEYEISFHFAELLGGKVEGLVYSLGDGDRSETEAKRIFTITANDKKVLENFNIAHSAGSATAIVKTIKLLAEKGNGIYITFLPVEGEPVLNALQVKKI